MSIIESLAHVCIKTTNLNNTTGFYCGALGMKKLFNFTRRGEIIGFYIEASSNTFIEVFHQDEATPESDKRNLHHLCLQAASLEKTREALLDRGYLPGEIKMGADHSLQFWVEDPSGVAVEFHEYTAQSSQLTGQDVEVNW